MKTNWCSERKIALKRGSTLERAPSSVCYLNGPLSRLGSLESIKKVIVDEQLSRNYNSVFFENEITKEQYNKEIQDALKVRYLAEVSFGDPKSKPEYDNWIKQLSKQY
jgi:hypothetical protein